MIAQSSNNPLQGDGAQIASHVGEVRWVPHARIDEEPVTDIALRQWAFERAQQIIGTTALTEDVIESADAILAWVTKRNTNG